MFSVEHKNDASPSFNNTFQIIEFIPKTNSCLALGISVKYLTKPDCQVSSERGVTFASCSTSLALQDFQHLITNPSRTTAGQFSGFTHFTNCLFLSRRARASYLCVSEFIRPTTLAVDLAGRLARAGQQHELKSCYFLRADTKHPRMILCPTNSARFPSHRMLTKGG